MSGSQSISMSKARIKLMYRAIVIAIISSIVITPIALYVSYKFSKARYDRIVERQVGEFGQRLFSKITPASQKSTFSEVVSDYISYKKISPSSDANFSYILLADEFDQRIVESDLSELDRNMFSKRSVVECSVSLLPIISYGRNNYFCSKSPVVNGHTHYTLYGFLRVSDKVVADFIENAIVICGITSFIAMLVSFVQYYISIKVSRTLVKANVKTLLLLGNTIALRDNDTFHHNLRVMIYSYYFGTIMRLAEQQMNELISGALLHDIGKIGIPDAVLQKPGKLTSDEFEVIKSHVALGEKIMVNSDWVESGVDIIKYHHERFDGKGYPHKLSGNDIPIIARMFAIVDVFDAITSERPYKKAKSYEDTMTYLISAKGGHFDAELVDKFIDISRMLFENYSNRNNDDVVAEANRILNVYYG